MVLQRNLGVCCYTVRQVDSKISAPKAGTARLTLKCQWVLPAAVPRGHASDVRRSRRPVRKHVAHVSGPTLPNCHLLSKPASPTATPGPASNHDSSVDSRGCTCQYHSTVLVRAGRLPVASSSKDGASRTCADLNFDYSHATNAGPAAGPPGPPTGNLNAAALQVQVELELCRMLPVEVTGTGAHGQQGPRNMPPRSIARPAGGPPHRRPRPRRFVPAQRHCDGDWHLSE